MQRGELLAADELLRVRPESPSLASNWAHFTPAILVSMYKTAQSAENLVFRRFWEDPAPRSVRSGDPKRFHLAVEVAAFEAECGSRLRHVPAVFLQLSQNEFPFVGTARFVQRRIRMLGTLGGSAEEFGRQVMRFNARLRANDHEALHEIAQFANISRPVIVH